MHLASLLTALILFYVHDVDERSRVQTPASFYMGHDTTTSKRTVPELRIMSEDNNNRTTFAAQKKMRRFAARIMGSNAYTIKRKSEMDSDKMLTLL